MIVRDKSIQNTRPLDSRSWLSMQLSARYGNLLRHRVATLLSLYGWYVSNVLVAQCTATAVPLAVVMYAGYFSSPDPPRSARNASWMASFCTRIRLRKALTWPPPFHTSVFAAPGAQHELAISKSSSPYARTTK